MTKHSKPAAVEVLPPEDPNTADSEQSRLAANYALQAHEMTKRGAQMFAVGALICGFVLRRVKDSLPHGEFEKWKKKYVKSISLPTTKRYVLLVDRMREQQESKWVTVSHLLEASNPSEVTESHIKKIAPLIVEITEGKTFTELGRELGIFKPRETKDRKHAKKYGPRTGIPQVDAEHAATVWTDDLVALCESAQIHKDAINDKDLNRVAAALRECALQMGLMKIE